MLQMILFVLALACNIAAAIVNLRASRRLDRRARGLENDMLRLAMFVAAIADPASPVGADVRASARAALPTWIDVTYSDEAVH